MRLLDGHVFQIINKLEAHESKTLSRWRETAEYRQTNKLWLRHSQRIAKGYQSGFCMFTSP